MRLLCCLCLWLLCSFWCDAQDAIYTTSENKIMGKVVEVTVTDVKYKKQAHIDEPLYMISKSSVVLIAYANGVNEIMAENPSEHNSKQEESITSTPYLTHQRKPLHLYYLNPNLLSINALALANGDVTLMYDRSFLNHHLVVSFLGGYNFNARMGILNAYIVDAQDDAKKNIDIGAGIYFCPKNTKRVQYFIGLLGKYMSYNYKKVVSTANNQLHYEASQGYQFATMLTNGWLYRISPQFNCKMFASIGFVSNVPATRVEGFPKVYLGYCFGYRLH